MNSPQLKDLPPAPSGKSGWPWTEESPVLPEFRSDGSAWPRISIVTPSYNQEDFIEETIRSVLLQGYPNLEYIIIDGKSTDQSIDVIQKYAPWISYWISEPDRGQAQAINKGFKQASGDIWTWICSDDRFFPSAFETATKFLENPQIDFIFGPHTHINPRGEVIGRLHIPIKDPFRYMLYGMGVLNQECCFWHSSLHQKVGFLNESRNHANNYDFFLRLCWEAGGRCMYVPNYMGCFRVHSDQISANQTKGRQELKESRHDFIQEKGFGRIRLLLGAFYYLTVRRIGERGWRSLWKIPQLETLMEVIGPSRRFTP